MIFAMSPDIKRILKKKWKLTESAANALGDWGVNWQKVDEADNADIEGDNKEEEEEEEETKEAADHPPKANLTDYLALAFARELADKRTEDRANDLVLAVALQAAESSRDQLLAPLEGDLLDRQDALLNSYSRFNAHSNFDVNPNNSAEYREALRLQQEADARQQERALIHHVPPVPQPVGQVDIPLGGALIDPQPMLPNNDRRSMSHRQEEALPVSSRYLYAVPSKSLKSTSELRREKDRMISKQNMIERLFGGLIAVGFVYCLVSFFQTTAKTSSAVPTK